MEIKELRNREERKIHLDKKLNSEKSYKDIARFGRRTKDPKAREGDQERFYPDQHLTSRPILRQTVISSVYQTIQHAYPSHHIIPGIEVAPIRAQQYFWSPVELYNVSPLYPLTNCQEWMERFR